VAVALCQLAGKDPFQKPHSISDALLANALRLRRRPSLS